MRWIVFFEDPPEMLQIRQEREALHLAYLDQHADEIVIAGGCRKEPGGPFVGGLRVLEVSSRARALALIEADPYVASGLRRWQLRTWGKAFAERQVVL